MLVTAEVAPGEGTAADDHIGKPIRRRPAFALGLLVFLFLFASRADALDPHKGLEQYSRTVWADEHGLQRDTIHAITQTTDGYLWLATDDGLVRFDGYDFVTFNKANGLPATSIVSLAAASDGSLWIGTINGLAHYRENQFKNYSTKDGLPSNNIRGLLEDSSGTLWIVAGGLLGRFESGGFTHFVPGVELPLSSVRLIAEDRTHQLYIAGVGSILRRERDAFVPILQTENLLGRAVSTLITDRRGVLWIGGTLGLTKWSAAGGFRKYKWGAVSEPFRVLSLCEDRDGNIWVGSDRGIARIEGDQLVPSRTSESMVRSIFEDRQGNLWIASSAGLTRLRENIFTSLGAKDNVPSDRPTSVFQDQTGAVWVGFGDEGLLRISHNQNHHFTSADGLPHNSIYSIRERRSGELLVGTFKGLAVIKDETISEFMPNSPWSHHAVFDAIEDPAGNLWLAVAGGLTKVRDGKSQEVIPVDPFLLNQVTVLGMGTTENFGQERREMACGGFRVTTSVCSL